MRTSCALLGALLFTAFLSTASAGPVTWTILSGNFTDGGTFSGSFQYDETTQSVGAYSIQTIGGSTAGFPDLLYSSTTKTVDPYVNGFGGLTSISFYDIAGTPAYGGRYRSLILEFSGTLTNGGGLFNIDPAAIGSGSLECYNCDPYREVASGGSITSRAAGIDAAVPEPASLTFAGTGLAFLLWRAIARRRS